MTEIRGPPTKRINFSINVLTEARKGAPHYDNARRELTVYYPEEFIRSQNRRFVNVISVRAIQLQKQFEVSVTDAHGKIINDSKLKATSNDPVDWNEYLPDIYTLHCSFVHDEYNDGQVVGWLNEPLTVPRRYEQFQNERTFRLWVIDSATDDTSVYGNRIDLDNVERSFLRLTEESSAAGKYKYYYVLVVQLELEF